MDVATRHPGRESVGDGRVAGAHALAVDSSERQRRLRPFAADRATAAGFERTDVCAAASASACTTSARAAGVHE